MPKTAPPILGARYGLALQLAHQMHLTHVRKSTDVPYVSHVLSVSAIVLENGGDEDTAVAALLHDVVEDTALDLDAVGAMFGPVVREIVAGCSDTTGDPGQKPDWKTRKLAHIEHARRAGEKTRLVLGADKLHNARATLADLDEQGPETWTRFNAGADEIVWYYRTMFEVIGESLPTKLRRDLAAAVDALSAWVS
ncbi:MAG: bifunctional (p)ppGpp synthetase/guanosine-3',5'-bis(diphosphate) 3'-pyrophosphohydrolase [Myxococcales bacterium]|nr:bifunctional (p)ppGpp synthetase/guanosine-3',5'-bis(diphosphate) 3'-pyrophosphohydrolase [Myxococcales bacterium]